MLYAKTRINFRILFMVVALVCFIFSQKLWAVTDQNGRVIDGGMRITNNNCAVGKNNYVKVHIYGEPGCSDQWKTVNKGSQVTIHALHSYVKNALQNKDTSTVCWYRHEAEGTTGGKKDSNGTLGAYYAVNTIECDEDWADTCQCKN